MLKEVFKKIDRQLTKGRIAAYFHARRERRRIERSGATTDFHITIHYAKNMNSLLAKLCDQYGSDKGSTRALGPVHHRAAHTYVDVYERLFAHCRGSIKKVFECGLGTNKTHIHSNMGETGRPGASLRVWRDYFPLAQIYGADIDRDILFTEERIQTFFVDQTQPQAIAEMWQAMGQTDFDVMIDDGLHTVAAGICLFENSIQHLAGSGIYVIEDVGLSGLLQYQACFKDKPFRVDYINLQRPQLSLSDNNLIVVRRD